MDIAKTGHAAAEQLNIASGNVNDDIEALGDAAGRVNERIGEIATETQARGAEFEDETDRLVRLATERLEGVANAIRGTAAEAGQAAANPADRANARLEQVGDSLRSLSEQAAERMAEIGVALYVTTDDFRARLDGALDGVGARLDETGEEVEQRTSLMVQAIGDGADTAATSIFDILEALRAQSGAMREIASRTAAHTEQSLEETEAALRR
ncbi:MAG: hypothetical protein HOJ41_03165 [Rhodospirillaceae bacterium]|nr:hypothetical protein [Rhodospirillaceae bacterium]